MDKRRWFSFPVVGGTSLLVIFAVLCLTVFALLSVGTVQAGRRLSDASAQAVSDFYAADLKAEQVFAGLRAGEIPEGVTEENGVFRYACEISDTQMLCVTVQKSEDGWSVLQWQAVSSVRWQEDDSMPVWDGEIFR